MVPDPWTVLAEMRLLLDQQPIAERGRYYHHRQAIVLRSGMLLVEQRAALWHELVHARRGDTSCTPGMEASVDREAARWAIPLADLLQAVRGEPPLVEVADRLKTTEHLLSVRLRTLHPAERGELHRHLAERERAA